MMSIFLLRRILASSILLSLLLVASDPVTAQPTRLKKASISLAADRTSYSPGETARLAVLVDVESGWHVNSNKPTFDYLIPTEVSLDLPPGWPAATPSYPPGEMKTFAFADQPISVYDGQFLISVELTIPSDVADERVTSRATLRYQACDDRRCLPPTTASASLELVLGAAGEPIDEQYFADPIVAQEDPPTPTEAEPRRGTGAERSLLLFMLFGIAGGLLLNAMPCVLPVLSLKLFGLVRAREEGRRHVVAGSLATAFGILASFWALALAAIGARAAGATVGWGVQFQEPIFVTFLTLVVVLFCLNLWGLFEVPLPSRLAGWAASSGSESLPSHFTAGLFATLMATPCSAPFLGTAVGFALSQDAGTILAIFSAVGLGMASPYLLLAVAPATVKVLPKPGPWMGHLKALMGFLLAAAAIWLLYVLSSQVSRERLAFIELALLALALFIWMRHKSGSRGWWRIAASTGVATAVLVALALASTAQPPAVVSKTGGSQLIPWIRFDRQEAESLARSGHLVFVDVTADWCFTCKVNERLALETPVVAASFERHGVIAMKADWTNRDEDIARFLSDHGKYGIPFYLLYRPGDEPHLFSELLTKEAVVEAVERAAENAGGRTAKRFESTD
jgi:thiol:disulfide interchange protein